MNITENYIDVNSQLWDKKTPYHTASAFYDNDSFVNGKNSLKRIETDLLGDINNKTILHLQCHFGQDTLSMARMGAAVTGVDFSVAAIAEARKLNETLSLNATFVCSDVYDLPASLYHQHDIVFSSYGTIVWLPDIKEWANEVATCLKPGGRFVFVETHPLALMFDDDFTAIKYSYFDTGVIVETEAGTYADRAAEINMKSMTWNHSLADVLQALIDAGLSISQFREYNYSEQNCFGNMTEVAPGKFQVIGMENLIPLVYAIEAHKPV
jgi:ubiquinone/menaquinone biosynthesis C-methylase UbiE